MRKTCFLLLAACSAFLSSNPNASADIIADAAGDYVAAAGSDTATLTTLPPGWSYFYSSDANGGTEVALTPGVVGFLPNLTGDANSSNRGFVGADNGEPAAAVQGTNPDGDPAEFVIFSDGQANNAVVGTDLLLHPPGGFFNNESSTNDFVIARYTVSATDLLANSGSISGSFRELIEGGRNPAAENSVDVSIYQNSTELFDAQGGVDTPRFLEQAAGTFNLTGLTFSEGDTIDFVVDNNGFFGGDETALQAVISADVVGVPEPSSLAILVAGSLGLVMRRRR